MNRRYLVIDFETYSEADIDVGANAYARHPSTEILCAAWKLGTKEELANGEAQTHQWCPRAKLGSPLGLIEALEDDSVFIVAQNSGFERAIIENVLLRQIERT